MSYVIEITLTDPPGPEAETGMPTYRLPTAYDDAEGAAAAAMEYIEASGLRLGSMSYNIVDQNDRTAVTYDEPAP